MNRILPLVPPLAAAALLLLALPAEARGKAEEPKIDMSIITEQDYPAEALRMHEQGTVKVRIAVDAAGAVSNCAVAASSGSASLDETTCRLFRERAHFTPAHDRRGRAVPGEWTRPITWRISDEASTPEFSAAFAIWTNCLAATIRPLLAGADSREKMVEKAFAACPDQEAGVIAVSAKVKNDGQPFTSAGAREAVRPLLFQNIDQARATLAR